VVDSGTVNSGRDIAFDAANNIHMVTSGDQLYRVLAPGGHTPTTLSWNGSSYSFTNPTISAGITGDYNINGVVDAADYVLWRNAGPTDTLPNDSSPGTVDVSDYNAWRANFNKPGSGSGAAVPEPAAAVLLLVASAFGACSRRRSA
jgi:hypothetical protein